MARCSCSGCSRWPDATMTDWSVWRQIILAIVHYIWLQLNWVLSPKIVLTPCFYLFYFFSPKCFKYQLYPHYRLWCSVCWKTSWFDSFHVFICCKQSSFEWKQQKTGCYCWQRWHPQEIKQFDGIFLILVICQLRLGLISNTNSPPRPLSQH